MTKPATNAHARAANAAHNPDGLRSEPVAHAARLRSLQARIACFSPDELRVLDYLAMRLELGRERYGALNLAADQRDFANEEREEHLDAIVYRACAEVLRLDRVRADLRELAAIEMVENGLRELVENAPAISVEAHFDLGDMDDTDEHGGEAG